METDDGEAREKLGPEAVGDVAGDQRPGRSWAMLTAVLPR
jgi:hypothetical protein